MKQAFGLTSRDAFLNHQAAASALTAASAFSAGMTGPG
jgi:hypothetical protein